MKSQRIRTASILTGAIAALLAPVQARDSVPAQPATDINTSATALGGNSNPTNIIWADDKIYFVANDAKGKSGLYAQTLTKTAKVSGVRVQVTDPNVTKKPLKIKGFTDTKNRTKTADNFVVAPNVYPPNRNTLYFHVQGDGLYTTRGTAATTIRLLKWNYVDPDFGPILPYVTPFQGSGSSKKAGVVFTAFKSSTGFEPFITTGTVGSTKLIKDIFPGKVSSYPYNYCVLPFGDFQSQVFFGAYDPLDLYQLFRYKQNNDQKGFTTDHFVVSRTTNADDNFDTAPFGLTLAGNNVVYSAGLHANDNGLDVGLFDTVNGTSQPITSGSINPNNFGTSDGTSALFGALNGGTSRVLWSTFGGSPIVYDDAVVGTEPRKIKLIQSQTYIIADENGAPHLYRKGSIDNAEKIKADGGGDLIVSEYVGVADKVYIVGSTGGGPNILWILDNQNTISDVFASPVKTAGNNFIVNPSGLASAVRGSGAALYTRVYFSCAGVGTEFQMKKDKNGNDVGPRGQELWVYDPGD